MHLSDTVIKSVFSFYRIRIFVLIESVQDMKNLDADVASVQHENVRFANLSNQIFLKQIICIYFCIMINLIRFIKSKLLSTKMLVVLVVLFFGCSKVVEIDVPFAEPKLVIEGVIKEGKKPIVLLSMSQGYFDPISDLSNSYISGADVKVVVENDTTNLMEVPALYLINEQDQLDYLFQLFEVQITEDLTSAEDTTSELSEFLKTFSVYTLLGQTDLIGETGKEYELIVNYGDISAGGTTSMLPAIEQEEGYFFFPESSQSDSLGVINLVYTDPPELGNCYRWASRRINQYPDWHILSGQIKDPYFVYPLGSVWDDMIVNGGQFSFPTVRYPTANDTYDSTEIGLWKIGDTVLTKLETIDRNAYETLLSYETALSSQGNPFAPPTNVISHVGDALGWWIAISEDVDTIICPP